jgi:hypothetical protein
VNDPVADMLFNCLGSSSLTIYLCVHKFRDASQTPFAPSPNSSVNPAADRALSDFQAAALHLEESLGAISGRLPEETAEELAGVRALLTRTKFELPPPHAAQLQDFRHGV